MRASGPDDTIRRLLDAYRRGETMVQDELARAFARIAAVDRAGAQLNAVLRIDPDAQWTARRLDAERQAGTAMGSLHGVPVLLKDNVDTGGPRAWPAPRGSAAPDRRRMIRIELPPGLDTHSSTGSTAIAKCSMSASRSAVSSSLSATRS